MGFAKEKGLSWVRDEADNVVIYKPGSIGYEDHAPVILQGHLDMVAAKIPTSDIQLEKEGLRLCTDGTFVWADGTTLGGDDGIAVAYGLALLEAEDLPHPPLEVVFTADEEIGMLGAAAMDMSVLRGRRLLNIDSEDEGVFTAGCAGGATCTLTAKAQPVSPGVGEALQVTVSGLLGGHSGMEIHKDRANGNKLLGQLLTELYPDCPFQLVSISGGAQDNAIPVQAQAVILTPQGETACHRLQGLWESLAPKLKEKERAASLCLKPMPAPNSAMSYADTQRILGLLCAVPNGVQAMSRALPGQVETSLNLGILRTTTEGVELVFSVRSGVDEEKDRLLDTLHRTAAAWDAQCQVEGAYPAWAYREDSPLRQTMTQIYARQYGQEPKVEVIHAGLECGIFAQKLPGLDCVSFGPNLLEIHTTRERMEVASVARTWRFLTAVLAAL